LIRDGESIGIEIATECAMTSATLPGFEGPREKLAAHGSQDLSDGELVAILLGTGTHTRPAPALAEQLLCSLGGLRGLVHAGVDQLAGVSGIGAGKAARIAAALELGRRANALPLWRGTRINSSEDVYRAFGPLLAHAQHEELWAIALDARQRVLSRALLARGGLRACPVTASDVFRPLVRAAASATILVHNHPSGAPEPSADDLALTEHLGHAGQLLGITLLDHVIVAAEGYFSCLDAGLYQREPGAS
jgi:DNA repair protein RadC